MDKDTYRLERSQRSDTSRICTRDLESGELKPKSDDRGVDRAAVLRLRRRRRFWHTEMRKDAEPARLCILSGVICTRSRVGRDTSPSYRAAVCRLRGTAGG